LALPDCPEAGGGSDLRDMRVLAPALEAQSSAPPRRGWGVGGSRPVSGRLLRCPASPVPPDVAASVLGGAWGDRPRWATGVARGHGSGECSQCGKKRLPAVALEPASDSRPVANRPPEGKRFASNLLTARMFRIRTRGGKGAGCAFWQRRRLARPRRRDGSFARETSCRSSRPGRAVTCLSCHSVGRPNERKDGQVKEGGLAPSVHGPVLLVMFSGHDGPSRRPA
jgi:hypothetical protein